jgi:hypothetical protein
LIPVPLPGPDIVALAGADFHAQAAVTDPATGEFGTTQGLLLEVVLHPMLAFATTETGLVLFDLVAGTTTPVTAFPAGTVFFDAVFGNGGADLFVATDSGLYVIDTLAPAPTPVLLTPGIWKSLVWDRVYNRLIGVFTLFGVVRIVDGDRASATFGTIIGQTGTISGSAAWVALSADGRLIAVINNFGSLDRVHADPTAPNYLTLIQTPPLTVFGFGTTVGRVLLSPDGRVAAVPLTDTFAAPQTNVWRFDGGAGQWMDQSPLFGLQALSALTVPGVPSGFGILPAREGSHWVLTSTTAIVRLRLDLDSPLNVVATTMPVAPATAGRLYPSLSPSGRYLVQRDWTPLSGPSANVVSLVDVSSGGVIPLATLMGTSNSSAGTVAAWR